MGNCSNNATNDNKHEDIKIDQHKGKDFNGTNYIFSIPTDISSTSPSNKLVVCVHGIGSFNYHFESLSNYLVGHGYTVLRFDLIGRGFSSYPSDNDFGVDAHIEQLRNLIVHLGLNNSKYHLIGHSMGGALASLYSERYLQEISSIVLLSPAGLMDLGPLRVIRGARSTLGALLKSTVVKSGQESAWRQDFSVNSKDWIRSETSIALENDSVKTLHSINTLFPHMFEAFWQSAMQFPLSGIESTVSNISACPHVSVLVMWGEKDTAVPFNPNFNRWKRHLEISPNNSISDTSSVSAVVVNKDDYEAVSTLAIEGGKEKSKCVEFVTFKNLGHGFFLEEPVEVQENILKFLNARS